MPRSERQRVSFRTRLRQSVGKCFSRKFLTEVGRRLVSEDDTHCFMITSTLIARSPRRSFRGLLLAACFALLSAALASAAEAPKKTYNLPAADAVKTLKAFSEQSGEQIVYPVEQV